MKGRKKVKAREIIVIGALFFAGFVVSEFFIEHMVFETPFQRFLARVFCQAQFYLLVYLAITLADMQKRVRRMDIFRSRVRRLRRKTPMISDNGLRRKRSYGRNQRNIG